MSAPRRWKDTHDAPVGVRELLSAARPPRAIDTSALERGAGRVAKIAAAPVAVGVTAALSTKLAAAAVIGLATVGAVVVAKDIIATEHASRAHTSESRVSESAAAASSTSSTSSAPAPAAEPPSPAPVEAVAPVRADALSPAPALSNSAEHLPTTLVTPPVRTAAAPIAAQPHVPAAPTVMLSAEISLLEEARAALPRDPTRALAKVAEHRARHPSGVLGAERDLIELDALRRTGRSAEARARAEVWLTREPSGLHAPRVRAILGSLDGSLPRPSE